MQRLAELTTLVTEMPWKLSPMHRERAHDVGLDDDDILHAIMLASHVGHMNRISDAVGMSLEYDVEIHADPSTPSLQASPVAIIGRPAIDPRGVPLPSCECSDGEVTCTNGIRRSRAASAR